MQLKSKESRQAALLRSALKILTEQPKHYTTEPWRNTMTKSLAKERNTAAKVATKKAASKGVTPYKHEPKASDFGSFALGQLTNRVDERRFTVVESNLTNPQKPEIPMTTEAQSIKEEATKAKMAAKMAKQEAALKAKAEKAAAAEAKKAEKEATKKAVAEAIKAVKAEKEAIKANSVATVTKMGALRGLVASGVYVKGTNGQMRSTDEVAVALDAVPTKQVISVLLDVLGLDENPYVGLNYGQQSMNLRNRLRGAIRKGAEVDGVKFDLAHVQSRVAEIMSVQEAT